MERAKVIVLREDTDQGKPHPQMSIGEDEKLILLVSKQEGGRTVLYADDCEMAVMPEEAIRTAMQDKGARLYLLQPIDGPLPEVPEALRNHHRDDVMEDVRAVCMKAGVPAHLQGFSFLCLAVCMVLDRPESIHRITKELYPGIALITGTTPTKVERSIRHAVQAVWERGRPGDINHMVGMNVCVQDKRMTNGEFIALLANHCRQARLRRPL